MTCLQHVFRHLVVLLIASIITAASLSAQTVKTGVDNLYDTGFGMLRDKRVVLVTHAAARVYTGRSSAEEFQRADNLTLVRILTPEHGFYGVVRAGDHVGNDQLNGTPLISLYGKERRPSRSLLNDADVVVIDLQDIGTRSYTYISTMTEVMDACAEFGVAVVVLDRPNPLGGTMVDGTLPDSGFASFVCRLPIPYVHGMTIGELAGMIVGEKWLSRNPNGLPRTCALTVVHCKRWSRTMSWETTGLPWFPTSPNIPTLASLRAYPVTGLLGELGGISIGIGSTMPFMAVGAPELVVDSTLISRLAAYGVQLMPCRFMPMTGVYANKVCNGYQIYYHPDSTVQPFVAGMALIAGLRDAKVIAIGSGGKAMFSKVCGTPDLYQQLSTGVSWIGIERRAARGVHDFKVNRVRYLLY